MKRDTVLSTGLVGKLKHVSKNENLRKCQKDHSLAAGNQCKATDKYLGSGGRTLGNALDHSVNSQKLKNAENH